MNNTPKLGMRTMLRSTNHIGKDALKFQFELLLTRVHGLTSGQFAVKLTRGTKVIYSNPITIDEETKHGVEVNQKLSLVCTLFRPKARASNESFDSKDSKLSIVSMKKGKVVGTALGKVHFNLAEYSGVPHTETRQSFNFNDQYTIETIITATFLNMHNSTKTPLGSEISGLTCNSSELGPDSLLFEYNNVEELTSPVTLKRRNAFETRRAVSTYTESDTNRIRAKNSPKTKINQESLLTRGHTSSKSLCIHTKSGKSKKGPGQESSDSSTDNDKNIVRLKSENSSLKKELSRALQALEAEVNQGKKAKEDHSKSDNMATNGYNSVSNLSKNDSLESCNGTEKSNIRCSIFEWNKRECRCDQGQLIASLLLQLESCEKARFEAEEAQTRAIEELNCIVTAQAQKCNSNSSQGIPQVTKNDSNDTKQSPATPQYQEKKYQAEVRKREELEGKVRSITTDNAKLKTKVKDYDLHIANAKKTYDELSAMYAELREEHIRLQEEMNMVQEEIIQRENDSSQSKLHMKVNDIPVECCCNSIMDKELKSEEQVELDKLRAEVSTRKQQIACLKQAMGSENSSFLGQIAALKSEREENKQEIIILSQSHEKLKEKYQQIVEKSRVWENDRIANQVSIVRGEAANYDSNNSHSNIFAEDRIPLDEIENMIETIQYEMQSALRLDKNSELELYNMSTMVEYLAPRMRAVVEQELTRQSSLTNNLKECSRQVIDLETCLFVQKEKEKEYIAQVKDLQRICKGLEEKSRKEWVRHEVETVALQKKLELKIKNLEAAITRIKSIENELREKKRVFKGYRQKIECLEEERQILESQAARELNLARGGCKSAGEQHLDKHELTKKYQNEVENLHTVIKNLEEELEKSHELVRTENVKALICANQNKHIREEARIQERKYQEDSTSQQEVIDLLENSISSIVQLWDKDVQEVSQNKEVFHGIAAEAERERESSSAVDYDLRQKEEVLILKNRISELTANIEEYSQVIKNKSEYEKELRTEIESLQTTVLRTEYSLVRTRENYEAQLNDSIFKTILAEEKCLQFITKNEKLTEQNLSLEEKLSEISQTMFRREEEWSLVSTENIRLESNIKQILEKKIQLNEELETLRNEFARSQERLYIIQCSSAADASRTRTELDEIKVREEAYRDELETKKNIIFELQSKLVDISSKNAADRITIDIQLIESRSREKSYQMEIERQRETVRALVARFKDSNEFSAFSSSADDMRRAPANSIHSTKMLLTS